MYQNFTPRPENKHDNGTSPLLIRDTSSFMFVVFLLLFLSFRWCSFTLLPRFSAGSTGSLRCILNFRPTRRFFFCGWEKNGGETHMFPCLSAKLCFNSSSSYGKLIATFVWRGVWDSSILNWTLNFISSCFFWWAILGVSIWCCRWQNPGGALDAATAGCGLLLCSHLGAAFFGP